MLTDYSPCSDVQGFINCDICRRNPNMRDIETDPWQSWIEPEIERSGYPPECLDFKEVNCELER